MPTTIVQESSEPFLFWSRFLYFWQKIFIFRSKFRWIKWFGDYCYSKYIKHDASEGWLNLFTLEMDILISIWKIKKKSPKTAVFYWISVKNGKILLECEKLANWNEFWEYFLILMSLWITLLQSITSLSAFFGWYVKLFQAMWQQFWIGYARICLYWENGSQKEEHPLIPTRVVVDITRRKPLCTSY